MQEHPNEEESGWPLTPAPEDEWHFRASVELIRERLRVARHRAADRQRLAWNARAARPEEFAVRLCDAADAHAATVRALEAALARVERCWCRIEEQRRVRERAARSRCAASNPWPRTRGQE